VHALGGVGFSHLRLATCEAHDGPVGRRCRRHLTRGALERHPAVDPERACECGPPRLKREGEARARRSVPALPCSDEARVRRVHGRPGGLRRELESDLLHHRGRNRPLVDGAGGRVRVATRRRALGRVVRAQALDRRGHRRRARHERPSRLIPAPLAGRGPEPEVTDGELRAAVLAHAGDGADERDEVSDPVPIHVRKRDPIDRRRFPGVRCVIADHVDDVGAAELHEGRARVRAALADHRYDARAVDGRARLREGQPVRDIERAPLRERANRGWDRGVRHGRRLDGRCGGPAWRRRRSRGRRGRW